MSQDLSGGGRRAQRDIITCLRERYLDMRWARRYTGSEDVGSSKSNNKTGKGGDVLRGSECANYCRPLCTGVGDGEDNGLRMRRERKKQSCEGHQGKISPPRVQT
jgi:hypothetical protein